MQPRVLLTTACGPFGTMDGASINDIHGSRLTHGQDIFSQRSYYPALPLYVIAQNITAPTTVLENPTMSAFEDEVRRGYEYVGITFPPVFLDKIHRMCRRIRDLAPKTRIVLGGYGVFCLEEDVGIARQVKELADHVCRGEGVRFMRELLGEPVDRPLTQDLPCNRTYFMDQPASALCNLVSSLGCRNECEFCSTSAFFRHQKVYLLSAAELWGQMKKNARARKAELTWIYDEDFFDPPEYARELAGIIKADRETPKRLINWGALGSVKSLSRFAVDEFLEMGVNHLWVGVESKFSDLPKRQGKDLPTLVGELHRSGIMTIASYIIGQDCQTPANIEEDIDFFVGLDPTFTQVTCMLPCPGTKFWKRLEAEGRLNDFENFAWDDYHMYTALFRPRHFTGEQVLELIRKTYERCYHRLGPSMLRALEVHLNGLDYCSRSSNPYVRDRSAYYADMCAQIRPLLSAIGTFAPSQAVAQRVERLRERCRTALGDPPLSTRALSALAVAGAAFLKIRPRSWQRTIEPVSQRTHFNGAS